MIHAGGACFEFEGIVGQTPVLRDLNGRCSVTNAAEAVVFATLERVRTMMENHPGPGPAPQFRPRAIVYRDSAGMWDALRLQGREFDDYILLNASTLAEAFEKLATHLGIPVGRLFMSAGDAKAAGL
jgi:hypothetical protein